MDTRLGPGLTCVCRGGAALPAILIAASAISAIVVAPGLALAQRPDERGEVTVSLSTWQAAIDELARLEAVAPPPRELAIVRRAITVSFDRGVLSGELEMDVDRFEGKDQVGVPLIDAQASLAEVTVDGQHAVAVRAEPYYAVITEKAGLHHIHARFALGREESRFSRSFVLALPASPITRVSLDLPEKGLDVGIEGGVVLSQHPTEQGTRVEGALDSREVLAVRWQRRLTHRNNQNREMEVQALSLASITEEIVRIESELHFRLISGETDRVELRVPGPVEVTDVTGDAILQWYTEADAGAGDRKGEKRLIVLLRHLVEDEVTVVVHAQTPRTMGSSIAGGSLSEGASRLFFVEPIHAPLREGFVAVEGRDGFEVTVTRAQGAEEVGTREVPPRLSDLSDKPLLFAYRYRESFPEIDLAIKRNAQIELTQAIIDDLQASTVLVEQGVEITKMRLFVRNNTRQYLSMRLPENASLTHALIDGTPFHPAVAPEEGDARQGTRLLIPLRQSEKLSDAKPRRHVVKTGETLGEIALLYFNRTDRWDDIIAANPGLYGPGDLHVGQKLVIPASAGGVALEESNFVLELAYKVQTTPLSLVSSHRVNLPEMDIPVMSVTWHYYFPHAYEPIRFDSNLKQLTAIRYDPMRRVLHFLEQATRIQDVWAGGGPGFSGSGEYSNILASRKAIYQREQRRQVTEALSAFPLVGDRYRFSRVLLGERPATIELVYLKRSMIPFIQWGSLILVLVLAARFSRSVLRYGVSRAIQSEPFWTLAATLLGLLVVSHFVLGVHRHLILGVDSALMLILIPRLLWMRSGAKRGEGRRGAIHFERLFRFRTLLRIAIACAAIGIAVAYPLLLSTFALALLLVMTFSARDRKEKNV